MPTDSTVFKAATHSRRPVTNVLRHSSRLMKRLIDDHHWLLRGVVWSGVSILGLDRVGVRRIAIEGIRGLISRAIRIAGLIGHLFG